MTLSEIMQQRRSVRKFRPEPVPEPMLRAMIEAAICAPSASNRQPWRFMVVNDPAVSRRLADCVREKVAEMAAESTPGCAEGFADYCRYFLHFGEAPALILALYKSEATMAELFRDGSSAREQMKSLEIDGARMSVAMAVQNMCLTAADQGLGTCVMTGPLIAEESFNEMLSIPAGWRIQCLVTAGYPDEVPGVVRRKTVEQIIIK